MTPSQRRLELFIMPEQFAIVRLANDEAVPSWATQGGFFSITRTADELSIVCAAEYAPDNLRGQIGWRVLQVRGPFALTEVGVLASLTAPLAVARISLFVVSTFDTDYLLIDSRQLHAATDALREAGHTVCEGSLAS
jgi:hypothetical protein